MIQEIIKWLTNVCQAGKDYIYTLLYNIPLPVDGKLLKVMTVLGFGTHQIGNSIYYLTSETVPVCFSK